MRLPILTAPVAAIALSLAAAYAAKSQEITALGGGALICDTPEQVREMVETNTPVAGCGRLSTGPGGVPVHIRPLFEVDGPTHRATVIEITFLRPNAFGQVQFGVKDVVQKPQA